MGCEFIGKSLTYVTLIEIVRLYLEMEMDMKKLEDPTVRDHWILYIFPFLFLLPHQIFDPNTTLISPFPSPLRLLAIHKQIAVLIGL